MQAGTSHNLGTNFAKAFDITYLADTGERLHVHQTSWGMSTRVIGMTQLSLERIFTDK